MQARFDAANSRFSTYCFVFYSKHLPALHKYPMLTQMQAQEQASALPSGLWSWLQQDLLAVQRVCKGECTDKMVCCVRRARQQQEWEERQAERKARQAEMAGEPFDKEVSFAPLGSLNNIR